MKIRQGFVSNSSSSSFLIYGVSLEHGELVKLLQDSGKEFKDYEENVIDPSEFENMELYELTEFLEIPKESGITVESPSYYDQVYIGTSWHLVNDDETGKEFKNRVLKGLKEMGLKVKKEDLGTHEAAWHD